MPPRRSEEDRIARFAGLKSPSGQTRSFLRKGGRTDRPRPGQLDVNDLRELLQEHHRPRQNLGPDTISWQDGDAFHAGRNSNPFLTKTLNNQASPRRGDKRSTHPATPASRSG